MYFSKIALIAAATMASTVVADDCFKGWQYCADNLRLQGTSHPPLSLSLVVLGIPIQQDKQLTANSTGNYLRDIKSRLMGKGQMQEDPFTLKNGLFLCGEKGDITFLEMCYSGCFSEAFGSRINDTCIH
jgi:hypothetical protein